MHKGVPELETSTESPLFYHGSGALSGGIQNIQNIVHFYKHVNMGKYRRDSILMSYNY
jgi:hypothetical protein